MQTLIKAGEVINGGLFRATPLNARFDEQLIAPNIAVCELQFLLPLLCRDMYEDMISKQNALVANYNPAIGAIVLKFPNDANYELLWTTGGLGMLAARAVYYQSLPYIGVQTGSNGIYMVDAEQAKNASEKMLKYLRDNELSNVKVLIESVGNYICQNSASYTLYPATERCKDTTGCDDCGGLDSEQKNSTDKTVLSRFGLF